MHQNNRCRPLRDRLAKHFARMHERRIKNTTSDGDIALQPVLGVQHRHVKLLDW